MLKPLWNTYRTWSGIACINVLAIKFMGAATWSWPFTLFVCGILGVSSFIPEWIRRLVIPQDVEPADGGDVTLTPGRGARGGHDGTIVVVGDATARVPVMRLTWRTKTGEGECDPGTDFYVTRDSRPTVAREGSILLALNEGALYIRRGGEWKSRA